MLIVEAKTRFGDLQETLGRLDVKARLGAVIAAQLRWPSPAMVAGALVLSEVGTNRRVIQVHEPLFRRFALRGRAALARLRRPHTRTTGLLWFESPEHDQVRTVGIRRPLVATVPDEIRTGRP